MSDYAARVRAGAAWLDANHEGWRRRVFVDELKMSSDSECLIGQLFGSYYRMLSKEMLTTNQAYAFGFYETGLLRYWIQYPLLTKAWKQELAA